MRVMLMDINSFLSKYGNLKFWFVSYHVHYFKIKALTTEFDEVHVICNLNIDENTELRLDKEYPLNDFNVLCAMIKKNNGEIIQIDRVLDAGDYFK